MSEKRDVLDELKALADGGPSASGWQPTGADETELAVPAAVISRAIAEIERLRADVVLLRNMVGTVSTGPLFREIAQGVRGRAPKVNEG